MTTEQLLELATRQHLAGDLVDARRLYAQVLAQSPGDLLGMFRLGLLELQSGRPEAALPLIQHAAAAAPHEPRYQFGLGKTYEVLGQWPDSARVFLALVQANPRSAEARFGLGVACQAMGDYGRAIACYEAAGEIQPGFAEAFNNLGNCYHALKDLARAETAYRRALEIRPGYASAGSNLGTIMLASNRVDEAAGLLRAAVAAEPNVASHAVNLGAALCQLRQFAGAADVLRRAIELDKTIAAAHYNLANALAGLRQFPEAIEQFHQAIASKPDYADAYNNLANLHKELGEFRLAMAAYESALRAQPDSPAVLNNMGCLLRTLGRIEEAEVILRRGLALDPRHAALCNNLGNVLKDAGALDEAIACFRQALSLDPADWATHSNLVYALSFQATDAQTILDECRRWNDRHAAPLAPAIVPRPHERSASGRMRIGYLSPDFRDHCQALFTIPLLSNHDRSAFEIFCYSHVDRPDAVTRQIAGYADAWRDVRALDDNAACDLIRNDRIDILVDLTMHMSNGRPLVFARKPAPVHVAWLAYPGTTGMDAIDYRFSDPRLDPPEFDTHYCERTIRLADSFWCYHPLSTGPQVNKLPALERGVLTFGCLNNPCKLTDLTLVLWAGVLRALGDSRLVLMAPPGRHRQQLLDRLCTHGIRDDRVEFVPYRPRDDYLKTYHTIDIGLDTIPYNGHTTSFDSLWMGVPVVTRVGTTCVGRAGLSQLYHLDLLDLAADSDEAFVAAALDLAGDLPRLAELRHQLRSRLETSPLMNGQRFARNIEMAYRQIARAGPV